MCQIRYPFKKILVFRLCMPRMRRMSRVVAAGRLRRSRWSQPSTGFPLTILIVRPPTAHRRTGPTGHFFIPIPVRTRLGTGTGAECVGCPIFRVFVSLTISDVFVHSRAIGLRVISGIIGSRRTGSVFRRFISRCFQNRFWAMNVCQLIRLIVH